MISGIEKYLNAKELTLADIKKALETECKEAEVSALCTLSLATKALIQDKDDAYDLCNEHYENLQGQCNAFKEALELVKKVPELPYKDTTKHDTKLLKGFMEFIITHDMTDLEKFPTADKLIEQYLSEPKKGEAKC